MSLLKSFTGLTIHTRTFVSARTLHPKKFTSILQDVPVKPRNPWQIFLRENIKSLKQKEGKIVLQNVAKELGEKWKQMSEADKAKYHDIYTKENQKHQASLDKALANATPAQFREENALRKKYEYPLIRDPKQPKRPKNSFMYYLEHLRTSNDPILNGDTKIAMFEAGKKFKALGTSEHETFIQQAKEAREQYNKDLQKYNAGA